MIIKFIISYTSFGCHFEKYKHTILCAFDDERILSILSHNNIVYIFILWACMTMQNKANSLISACLWHDD